MRYDQLRPDALDSNLAWLADRGVHVYALLDDHEVREFGERFAGQDAVRALDTPILIYEPGSLRLFDLTGPARSTLPDVVRQIAPDRWDCTPPEPRPRLVWR
jgi:hypothetical protein